MDLNKQAQQVENPDWNKVLGFLESVLPRTLQALTKNENIDIFKDYNVKINLDDDQVDFGGGDAHEGFGYENCDIRFKLTTDYDFAEANNPTKKTIEKLQGQQADTAQNYANDDFDDEFNQNQVNTG